MNIPLSVLLSAAALAVMCGLALWLLVSRRQFELGPEIPEIRAHFNQMVAEYEALSSDRIDPKSQAEIDSLLRKSRDHMTWDDVYRFELLMLHLTPVAKLRRRAWLIRSRYRAIAGDEVFKRYMDSQPPENQPPNAHRTPGALSRLASPDGLRECEAELLRADLEVVLEDTHWLYRLRSSWETQRNWLSRTFLKLYAAFMLLLVVTVAVMMNDPGADQKPHPLITLLAVPFAGALGGFLSLMHRVHKLNDDPDRPVPLLQMEYGRGALLAQAMITGAVSGTALFLLFASGFVSEEIFPRYPSEGGILDLLGRLPTDGREFSKTLVWAFIAGFAERLVPDFLDHFARAGRRPTAASPQDAAEPRRQPAQEPGQAA